MKFSTDRLSIVCGKAGAVATVILLALVMSDVVFRFIFSKSFNWLIELEWHVFGLIFLLGGSFNIRTDKHVRVDFFYGNFSEKRKSLVNLILHLLFLMPWTLIGMATCYKYAGNSLYIREASPNPGGLPAMYPIKYVVVFCFLLMFLQAITEVWKEIKSLQSAWKS